MFGLYLSLKEDSGIFKYDTNPISAVVDIEDGLPDLSKVVDYLFEQVRRTIAPDAQRNNISITGVYEGSKEDCMKLIASYK